MGRGYHFFYIWFLHDPICTFCFILGADAGTHAAGKAFLEANSRKEGVITLPSGLQYKVPPFLLNCLPM